MHEKLSKKNPEHFKAFSEQGRVYPNYWAPILCIEDGKRVLRPMRYRFRPHWAEEDLPSKYSLNTARLDTLTTSKLWSKVFTHHHGILPLKSFLEWVTEPKTGKRALLSFRPKDHDCMFSPVIFDCAKQGKAPFRTFALITHEPTPEILKAGYDRCPVFLKEEKIQTWLETDKASASEYLETLLNVQTAFYESKKIR